MALIKCPFCGGTVSDQADKCPHCGADLRSGILCPECGTRLVSLDHPCPECGCPPETLKTLLHQDNRKRALQNHSKVRSASWVVVVIIVVALVVCGTILIFYRQNNTNPRSGVKVENTQRSGETNSSENQSEEQEEAKEKNTDEQVMLKNLQESENNTMTFTTGLTRDKERWYMVLLAESDDKKTGRAYVGGSDDGMANFSPYYIFLYEISGNHLKLSHGGNIRERNPISGYIIEDFPQEFDLEITSDGYTPLLTGIVPGDRSHNTLEIRFFNNYCPYGQKLRKLLHW